MKKITILLATVLISAISVNAQKKKDPKYEHHFKAPEAIITYEYSVNFSDVQSQAEFCKFAIKISNNTNDFLIFDKGASVFNFDFGQYSDKAKQIIIKPNDSKKKVLTAVGSENFQVDKFSLTVDGFSIVPVNGTVSKMEDFQVPASKNAINTDAFKVNLKKSSLKTQEASLIFECIYTGNKVALVNPSKLVIKVDDTDKEYANDNKKSQPKLILKKGDKVKVKAVFHIPGRVADMQFANMTILWKDTFVESEIKKLEGKKVDFELDRGMTAGKND
jgi:hypothetical protein